eukprot:scaffold6881_cov127-Skeletonema_marinoi.AAC.4
MEINKCHSPEFGILFLDDRWTSSPLLYLPRTFQKITHTREKGHEKQVFPQTNRVQFTQQTWWQYNSNTSCCL